jgi:hypothetical protein
MTDNDNIVRLAALMREADKNELSHGDFEREMEQADSRDLRFAHFVYKLMTKGRYLVNSSNPETFKRYRDLAQYIGATAEDVQSDWPAPMLSVLFSLPPSQ